MGICSKIGYASERLALDALKKHRRSSGQRDLRSLRAYECPLCQYFHIGHEEKTRRALTAKKLSNGETRKLRTLVEQVGRQIANGERRWLEQELRRIAKLVDADHRWLAEEAERTRLEAERIRDLAENLKLARKMEEEKTR